MIGGIILAAGSSRRFGDDKRKVVLASGQMMLEETIHKAASVLDKVLVVLRFGDRELANSLGARIDNSSVAYFLAPDSAKGMAHSLANAMHRVHDWEAALILLGDMPFVQAETIESILGAYEFRKTRQPIVVPCKDGVMGHPVLFAQHYYPEIEALTGDRGARQVIDAHEDHVYRLAVADPGVIRDIDTPGDLGG